MGHFPDDWKEALVFLLLKETAADFTFKNIRPVSNLPFISKLTENAASNQTHCHMAVNTFFHLSINLTYKKNHSTETAILKITNVILLNMNIGDVNVVFDTIDQPLVN